MKPPSQPTREEYSSATSLFTPHLQHGANIACSMNSETLTCDKGAQPYMNETAGPSCAFTTDDRSRSCMLTGPHPNTYTSKTTIPLYERLHIQICACNTYMIDRHAYTHIRCTHAHTYIYIYIYVCVCAYMHLCMRVCTHVCMYEPHCTSHCNIVQ